MFSRSRPTTTSDMENRRRGRRASDVTSLIVHQKTPFLLLEERQFFFLFVALGLEVVEEHGEGVGVFAELDDGGRRAAHDL